MTKYYYSIKFKRGKNYTVKVYLRKRFGLCNPLHTEKLLEILK